MLEPAKTVVDICGGAKAVAQLIGRDTSRVYRWGYPKEKGGSDGYIPTEIADQLLEKASHLGLRPEHFFREGRPNPQKSVQSNAPVECGEDCELEAGTKKRRGCSS